MKGGKMTTLDELMMAKGVIDSSRIAVFFLLFYGFERVVKSSEITRVKTLYG